MWQGVVDAHLLPHLLERGGKTVRNGMWMGALGFVIAVLALAGPSWRQGEQPLWQSQSPLVIAVDMSSAIAAMRENYGMMQGHAGMVECSHCAMCGGM